MRKISLIVPCYNEKEALPFFYNEVKKILYQIEIDYEILFVNDGSKDETLEIIKEFNKKDEKVVSPQDG